MLEVHDLHTYYGHIQALKGINLRVDQGEIVTLIGSNGAGKSTTLKTISGLIAPRHGHVLLHGRPIHGVPAHKVAALGVAQSPEGRRVFPRMTVLENLEMGAFARGKADPHDLARVYELFPRLSERATQKAGTLSGGEQQMLAIGRALVIRPKLLMVDELSLGLAPVIVEELMGVLKQLNAEGITVLVVEQHATLAMQMAERVLFMEKGRVRFSGDGRELLERPDLLRSVFLGG